MDQTDLWQDVPRQGYVTIYSLCLLIDFSSVCCSLSLWLSLGNWCPQSHMKDPAILT